MRRTIALADVTGAPVATVEAVIVRAVNVEQLGETRQNELFGLEWVPVTHEDVAAPESRRGARAGRARPRVPVVDSVADADAELVLVPVVGGEDVLGKYASQHGARAEAGAGVDQQRQGWAAHVRHARRDHR